MKEKKLIAYEFETWILINKDKKFKICHYRGSNKEIHIRNLTNYYTLQEWVIGLIMQSVGDMCLKCI